MCGPMTSALALALAKFWNLVSQPHKTFPKKRTECVLQTVVRAVGSASFFSLWGGLSVRLHNREMGILFNGGIRFNFSNWWLNSLIYMYF